MSEYDTVYKMQKMCIESLCPEDFEKWIEIKKSLFGVREKLKKEVWTQRGINLRDFP